MRAMMARSKAAHVGIVLGEEEIRTRLRARVAQPLGRDVAGLDVGRAVGRVSASLLVSSSAARNISCRLLVRVAIVGRGLLDRAQLEREDAGIGSSASSAATQQREQRDATATSPHYAGQVPCAYKAGQLPIAS